MTRASGRVMVVTAHPDDPEFGAGGTVAKLVKEGREVTYVIVTNGNKGSFSRPSRPGCDSALPSSGRRRAMPTPRGSTMSCCPAEDGVVMTSRRGDRAGGPLT